MNFAACLRAWCYIRQAGERGHPGSLVASVQNTRWLWHAPQTTEEVGLLGSSLRNNAADNFRVKRAPLFPPPQLDDQNGVGRN